MPKKITGVLINPDNGTAEKKTIEDSLESYYETLNCNTIDIVERTLDGKTYDIICDDEGLLKPRPALSATDKQFKPMLFGRLFVCHHDDEGEMTSLTDEEIRHVLTHCMFLCDPLRSPNMYYVLTDLGY